MTQLGLQPSEWGGETEFVDVSAKTQQGLEDLLDTILVVAELEELKANPDAEASGVVIESKLDPGRGPVVTVLIQRGTLRVGDALVAGAHWGKVRAMHDYTRRAPRRGRAGRPGRGPRLRRRPRRRRVRPRRRERPHRPPAGQRARRPAASNETLARRSGRKVSFEDVFKGVQAGRGQGARPRAQGRRLRLAGGLRGRDRQAAAGRGPGQRHRTGRRRHHRVRRHARRRVRRGHPRLQRPPGRRRPRRRRARGRRDPHLLGHLPGARRPARRDGGHARARGGRGHRRHRRGPPDLPRLAHRHDRRLLRHRRQRHARRARCASSATAPSSTRRRSTR